MTEIGTDPQFIFRSTGLDPQAARRLVADALTGCDDGELFLELSRNESLVWDDGRLKSASFDGRTGFGLRAVAGERTGYAHSSEVSER
ncbi:MAG TPA: metalloprotease TldD, partial [Thermopetrobacter sp.]|nr:metalloprotease TldD [Thermopetrobacter sp.]